MNIFVIVVLAISMGICGIAILVSAFAVEKSESEKGDNENEY